MKTNFIKLLGTTQRRGARTLTHHPTANGI